MRLPFIGMFLLASSAAGAQRTELPAGARVRVEVRGRAGLIEGNLVGRPLDSLIIAGPGLPHRVARADVVWVELYQGRSRASGAGKGALIGLVAGAVYGLYAESNRSPYDEGLQSPAAHVAIPAVFGALAGSVVGALVGSERWIAVDLPHRRYRLGLTR